MEWPPARSCGNAAPAAPGRVAFPPPVPSLGLGLPVPPGSGRCWVGVGCRRSIHPPQLPQDPRFPGERRDRVPWKGQSSSSLEKEKKKSAGISLGVCFPLPAGGSVSTGEPAAPAALRTGTARPTRSSGPAGTTGSGARPGLAIRHFLVCGHRWGRRVPLPQPARPPGFLNFTDYPLQEQGGSH